MPLARHTNNFPPTPRSHTRGAGFLRRAARNVAAGCRVRRQRTRVVIRLETVDVEPAQAFRALPRGIVVDFEESLRVRGRHVGETDAGLTAARRAAFGRSLQLRVERLLPNADAPRQQFALLRTQLVPPLLAHGSRCI